jgi:hypothetical protein
LLLHILFLSRWSFLITPEHSSSWPVAEGNDVEAIQVTELLQNGATHSPSVNASILIAGVVSAVSTCGICEIYGALCCVVIRCGGAALTEVEF